MIETQFNGIPNITLIHPSRGRAEMAFKTCLNWLKKADNPIEYILSLDTDNIHEYTNFEQYFNSGFKGHYVSIPYRENKSAIEAINYAATLAKGNIMVVCSDDFDCPDHWDTLLLSALKVKEDFCVKTDDGAQGFIITLPILDRFYYNRFGYIYNPLYQHMFCDTEMSCVAWMLDKYVTVPITFKHYHYSYGGMPKDDINIKNDATWEQGKEVFRQRYNDNFGITPVKELPEHSGIVKYMQTI